MKNNFFYFLLISLFSSLYLCTSAQNVGINTANPTAALDVNGDIRIRTVGISVANGITLALDVNSAKYGHYRVTGPTADFTIAGITEGIDGRLITLFNMSGFTMQLNHDDASAAAEDRIVTGTNANITIIDKGIITFQYDGVEGKWIVKSSSKGGTGGGGYWDISGNNIFNNNTGNVGIGVPIPLAKLHVGGNIKVNGNSTIEFGAGLTKESSAGKIGYQSFGANDALDIIGAGTLGSNRKITFWNEGGAEFRGSIKVNSINTIEFGAGLAKESSAGKIGYAAFGLFNALDIVGAGTTGLNRKITFWNEGGAEFRGSVGIGTNNPLEKLTVQTLNNSYGISHRGEGGNVIATFIGGTSAGIGTFSPTDMRFFVNGATRIFIEETTGNVGIGTVNPTYKLSVLGNIRSTEVVVETGWADYVFDNKYKLLPLDQLEAFIQQNKHLPNIPSAKEVEEKGLHLGDTQKRMMEKIEELTLYIIQLNKRIERLENK